MGALALPIAIIGSTLLSTSAANRANQRQEAALQQSTQAAQQASLPSSTEAAKYNNLVNQLAFMAGVNPSGMFLTHGLQGGATLQAPTPMSGQYSVIPQSLIDQNVGLAQQDVTQQAKILMQQALGDLAKRGLAGSSLVDEANAYATRKANQDVAKIRADQELQATQVNNQARQQALQLLMGLTPDNTARSVAALGALQTGLTNQANLFGERAKAYSGLGATGVNAGLNYLDYKYPGLLDPLKPAHGTQWSLGG